MNTIVYAEDWAVKLQERLAEPNKWKEVMNVEYTDTKVLHNPYMTDAVVQTGTRGSAYTHQAVVETDENITIDTFKILPQLVDRADLAQSTYSKQMELASRQGILLNEAIETGVFADYANLTTMDNADLGGSAGNITVSSNNVDDIIRAMKRKIRKANGEDLLNRNGAFIVWRPEDFEMLEAFVQSTGYLIVDKFLINGTQQGFLYAGVFHYSSNKLTAGHLIGGVKGVWHLGICRSTYGQVVIDDEPATSSGAISAIAVVSRVDFKPKAWAFATPVLFNITVA